MVALLAAHPEAEPEPELALEPAQLVPATA
jgi:hypothetical protein